MNTPDQSTDYLVFRSLRDTDETADPPSDLEKMGRPEMMEEITRLRGQIEEVLAERGSAQRRAERYKLAHGERKRREKEAKERATIDAMTGLYNKGFYTQHMPKLLSRAERGNLPCDLLVLDIDHFKSINDTYGHAVGDRVLTETADIIKKNLRNEDIGFRYGGEEFVVFLQDTEHDKGLMVAERIRKAIEDAKIEHEGGEIPITMSIGVSSFTGQNATDLFGEADIALYQAKTGGRNRVVSAPNAQMTKALQDDVSTEGVRTKTGS